MDDVGSAKSNLPEYIFLKNGNVRTVAKTSLARDSFEYNMMHKNRGYALIFDHENFKDSRLKRPGTRTDCKNLRKTLLSFGFNVIVHKDRKAKEINDCLEKISTEDHADNDCLLIAVFSHGKLGEIHAYDKLYKIDILWKYFIGDQCPSLAGKPKIFLIQACQGDFMDNGITLWQFECDTRNVGPLGCYTIPNYSDLIFAYSTIPGHVAWRKPDTGSWFIDAFCTIMEEHGKDLDFLTILTLVNRKVALDYESESHELWLKNRKQIPCIMSMLTRFLRFSEKKEIN